MAERHMWRPIAEERASIAALDAERDARQRKVDEMVAWLRAQYRAHGLDDPSRMRVAGFLDGDARWEALQEAVGRHGAPSATTRRMVLERFPVDGD